MIRIYASLHPLRVWLIVMATVFTIELSIMYVLPFFGNENITLIESLCDAGLLTITVAPVVWWLLIKPIQQLSQSRGRLLKRLYESQEKERESLSRDLHDEIGQHLTAISVGLSSLETSHDLLEIKDRINRLRQSSTDVHQCLRRIARGLRPYVIDQMGLITAMQRACEDYEVMKGITVKLTTNGFDGRRLPNDIETTLYRIFQEAMTNIARHSRASAVNVIFDWNDDEIKLQINDNGRGSQVKFGQAIENGSLGLLGMRERAAAHGGRFEFQTGISGTTVQVVLPAMEISDDRKNQSGIAR